MIEFDSLHIPILILGWLMGSFATACIYRIPREIPIGLFKKTRSFCPECEAKIPFYRNIPLFSYLFLKGKAPCCSKKISSRYFWVEFLTPVLFLVTYLLQLRKIEIFGAHPETDYWELAKVLYFSWSLLVLCFIDIDFRIIPDRFSLGNWVVALVAAYFLGEPSFILSVIGGAFGFGAFFLLAWSYEKIKKVEGLGFGDVKMMGWLGSWVGFFGVPFVILVASLTGLVVGLAAMRFSRQGLQTAIPFGPFLALGAYLAWAVASLGMW